MQICIEDMFDLPAYIFKQLNPLIQKNNSTRILIALSGGMDSCVLVHAIAKLAQRIKPVRIKAIHVNHGVHEQSKHWSKFCQRICEQQNIELKICVFALDGIKRNREAAYRKARHKAFSKHLSKSDILITAHHQHDQVETVLFNLFRGSGVTGIGGMKSIREFAHAFHLRPLLPLSRDVLLEYALVHKLKWIDDPSNQDCDFDRSYIRQQIIPTIIKRWPAALNSISRSAILLHQAENILHETAYEDIVSCTPDGFPSVIMDAYISVLDLKELKKLSYQRQINLVKYWIESNSRCRTTALQLNQIQQDLCSRPQSHGLFSLKGYQIRVYKGYLYLMERLNKIPSKLQRPNKFNHDYIFKDLGLKLKADRTVDFKTEFKTRQGGEKIKHNGQTRRIKKIFQDQNIPSWERVRIPLIYKKKQLIAVPGVVVADGVVPIKWSLYKLKIAKD